MERYEQLTCDVRYCRFVIHVVWLCLSRERKTRRQLICRIKEDSFTSYQKNKRRNLYDTTICCMICVLTVIGCVRKTFSFLARSRTNCFALLFEYTRSKKRFRSDDRSMVIRFIRLKNNISHSVMHATVSCLCHTYLSLSITVVCKSG